MPPKTSKIKKPLKQLKHPNQLQYSRYLITINTNKRGPPHNELKLGALFDELQVVVDSCLDPSILPEFVEILDEGHTFKDKVERITCETHCELGPKQQMVHSHTDALTYIRKHME